MDSTVCAAIAARDYDAYAVHFSYGQRTESRELQSAQSVAHILGFKQLLSLKMDLFRQIGGSALTDENIAVPDAPADDAHIGNEVPVTYVPFRNAHFLSAAVSWAEVIGAATILIGAVEQDSSGYPDCRPAYYDAFNLLIQKGTKEGNIRVLTPLIQMKKSQIVRLGVELGRAIACKLVMLFRWRSGLWSLRKLCASSACFSRSRSRRSHSVPHHPGSIRYC